MSCLECHFWQPTSRQTVVYVDGDKVEIEMPAPKPWYGECRVSPPTVVTSISGEISSISPYGKGYGSSGGGGKIHTTTTSAFPVTTDDCWCGSFINRVGEA